MGLEPNRDRGTEGGWEGTQRRSTYAAYQHTHPTHAPVHRSFVGSITNFAEALNPVGLLESTHSRVQGGNAEGETRESHAVASLRLAAVALERDALQQQVFVVVSVI